MDPKSSHYLGATEIAKLCKRKRASKACVPCRERKVRCDAVLRYPASCTNCDLDHTQCIIAPKSKRKRHIRAVSATNNTENTGILQASSLENSYHDHVPYFENTTQSVDDRTSSASPGESAPSSNQPVRTNVGSGLNQTLDSIHDSPVSSNSECFQFSTLNSSTKLQPSRDPTLESTINSQYLAASDQVITTSPTMIMNDFDGKNTMQVFSNFEELTDDSINSFLCESLHNNDARIDTGTSLDSLFTDAVDVFPSYRCRAGQIFPWVEAWPVQQLDDQSWTKVLSAKALLRPEWTTVERLLRLYFQYLNPIFPVVNELTIYRLVNSDIHTGGTAPKPISLALFNAIMFAASGFVLEEDAIEAGFSSIRSMSTAFFSRAKLLYDLGCEETRRGRVQICLLLSYRKSYEGNVFESEQFLLAADRLLEEANVPRILSEQNHSTSELNMWRRLYSSWSFRMMCITLGTKRQIALRRTATISIPDIQASALSDDISFSWFLSKETKKSLAHIFIAKVALVRLVVPFCGFLIKAAPDTSSLSGLQPSLANNKTVLAATEELEMVFTEWYNQYAVAFEPSTVSDMTDVNRSALFVQQSFLKLVNDYCISTLHQINLSFDNSPVTKWGSGMKQLSRQALWESVSSTTRTLDDLLSRNLTRYLPMSALACVLIPFTANNMFVKGTLRCNDVSLEDLSICARSLRILAERYNTADFYMNLLNESLAITHKMLIGENSAMERSPQNCEAEKVAIFDKNQDEIPLPQANIYSAVIRFQDMSFATGCIDKAKASLLYNTFLDFNSLPV